MAGWVAVGVGPGWAGDVFADAAGACFCPPPFSFACFCAKYCLLLTSKSGSCRYSSSDDVRLVGACLMFGICSRVDTSTLRAA